MLDPEKMSDEEDFSNDPGDRVLITIASSIDRLNDQMRSDSAIIDTLSRTTTTKIDELSSRVDTLSEKVEKLVTAEKLIAEMAKLAETISATARKINTIEANLQLLAAKIQQIQTNSSN